jgi:hypothetical protein
MAAQQILYGVTTRLLNRRHIAKGTIFFVGETGIMPFFSMVRHDERRLPDDL